MLANSHLTTPLIALIGWIPLVLILFHRLPLQTAILLNFLGGWALLPGANYAPSTADFPFWVQGVCLPTAYLVTKASVIGVAAVAGILLFHRSSLKNLRLDWLDLPLFVWCCVPVASSITHPGTLKEGLCGAAYQSIAWGIPWVLGRAFFSDFDSLLFAVKAVVIAALFYVPICLFELVTGPQVYAFLYGYQPYRWVGAHRYVGFRPIGMMEDGNQLGTWMAAATLLAFSLLRGGLAGRISRLQIGLISAVLLIITMLCQSVGSILILSFVLPIVLVKRRVVFQMYLSVLLLCIIGLASVRATGLLHLRDLMQKSPALSAIAGELNRIGRHSLQWRLAREENHLHTALKHPFLGSGEWNWWQEGDFRPWSMWILVLGTYGAVGLASFEFLLVWPVLRVAWSPGGPAAAHLQRAVIALVLMVAIDQFLNGTFILPYLLLIGALGSSAGRATPMLSTEPSIAPAPPRGNSPPRQIPTEK